ncbi:MAG: hypothetical protein RL434_2055 [Pseudomonadota bacterium]|jgi:hypothetical protein
MKLLSLLLLCLPLTVFADNHGSEHGGAPAQEHGGAPAEEQAPAADAAKSEHGGAPAEEKK